MAQVLDEFDWSFPRKDAYPWDEWLDGRVWQLRRGEDFTCQTGSIQSTASSKARKRGRNLRSRRIGDDTLVIQAR